MTTEVFHTPVGDLMLAAHGSSLILCDWMEGQHFGRNLAALNGKFGAIPSAYVEKEILGKAKGQLTEYFAGKRRGFDLPLAPSGTEFQISVWRALQQIPYGVTMSYGELASLIGRPQSVRAVANAVGRNPLSIITPCHRIIGSNGALTGYAGMLLAAKRYLLTLESHFNTPTSLSTINLT